MPQMFSVTYWVNSFNSVFSFMDASFILWNNKKAPELSIFYDLTMESLTHELLTRWQESNVVLIYFHFRTIHYDEENCNMKKEK